MKRWAGFSWLQLRARYRRPGASVRRQNARKVLSQLRTLQGPQKGEPLAESVRHREDALYRVIPLAIDNGQWSSQASRAVLLIMRELPPSEVPSMPIRWFGH